MFYFTFHFFKIIFKVDLFNYLVTIFVNLNLFDDSTLIEQKAELVV